MANQSKRMVDLGFPGRAPTPSPHHFARKASVCRLRLGSPVPTRGEGWVRGESLSSEGETPPFTGTDQVSALELRWLASCGCPISLQYHQVFGVGRNPPEKRRRMEYRHHLGLMPDRDSLKIFPEAAGQAAPWSTCDVEFSIVGQICWCRWRPF